MNRLATVCLASVGQHARRQYGVLASAPKGNSRTNLCDGYAPLGGSLTDIQFDCHIRPKMDISELCCIIFEERLLTPAREASLPRRLPSQARSRYAGLFLSRMRSRTSYIRGHNLMPVSPANSLFERNPRNGSDWNRTPYTKHCKALL